MVEGESSPLQMGKDYSKWSNVDLIDRVTELERILRESNARFAATSGLDRRSRPLTRPSSERSNGQARSRSSEKPKKEKREFDFGRYSTRFIALKFAYLGQAYNGLEHHVGNATPLPTIEEKLWGAMVKTRLIAPPTNPGQVSWDGCDYSKCGRTDKGVSAFGQVIALRVRSNRPKGATADEDFDPVGDEIPYARVLNRVLPDDIRVLAWCPSPPVDFSARFSCRERRYRYFFTQPALAPLPRPTGIVHLSDGHGKRDGWLDIGAMREAASYFEGLHDFRNFCKVDPSKQITNFERRVTYASVEEASSCGGVVRYVNGSEYASVKETEAKVYCFVVHGSAFLWHQVRHMVAMLFLVGQGLEQPSIIKELLDVQSNPCKPIYEMADDAPLVLWDCIFPMENGVEDGLDWISADDVSDAQVKTGDGRHGPHGLCEVLWESWRKRKIDEVLAGSLLDVVAGHVHSTAGPGAVLDTSANGQQHPGRGPTAKAGSTRVFNGDNGPRLTGMYVPVMKRQRTEQVEVVNARYALRKGLKSDMASECANELGPPLAIDDSK